jgi:branched-chain amino acid transport system permease protein
MQWNSRVQIAVNILVLAAIYALIACGYVLVYRVSRVLNLAHGELMMLGAYMLQATAGSFAGNPFMAIAVACGMSLAVGCMIYIFLMRRMTGEMVLAAVLTTVALGILLRGGIELIWSQGQLYPASKLGISNPSLPVPGGARISLYGLLLIVTAVAVYGALLTMLRYGRWGIRMRAAGQNPLLAAQRGIDLHRMYAVVWGLATLTGAIAGMLIALDSGLSGTMALIGLKAFPAALVGGLDSLVGALIGSLIVAAAEVLLIHYVDPLLSDVVPFLVLIAMLAVRPWGLFGTREELDRV